MNLAIAIFSSKYDYILLLLSLAICLAGTVFALQTSGKFRKDSSGARTIWLLWTALVMGTSLWAAAVFAISAQVTTAQSGFEMTSILAVLFLAVAGTFASFALSLKKHLRLFLTLSGIVFGSTAAATFMLVERSFKVAGATPADLPSYFWPFVAGAGLGSVLFGLALRTAGKGQIKVSAAIMAVPVAAAFLTAPVTNLPIVPHWFPAGMELLTTSQALTMAVLVSALCAAFTCSGDLLENFRKQAARRAYHHLALQDNLTHLPNRHYVENVAKQLLKEARDNETICAVVLVSLDEFKAINDLHGYSTGDAVLRRMASLFRAQFGDPVVIARFYGDEFLIIDPSVETPDDATALARKVRELARRPIQTENYRLSVQCSIGLAIYPRDGQNLNHLVQRANLAAKQAKAVGGNAIQPYVTGMEENNLWEAALASDLRNATFENQLSLLFQKQNQTQNGRLIGYEALVRWRHAEKGYIPPEDFIPIAERSGIILDIGAWVLREACREAANWDDPVTVSVNVSPYQFSRSDFSGLVSTVLMETGLSPHRLEIELTESTPIEDHERVSQTIEALQKMGIRVAMDDFGTGYSSLNTLQAFPFDKLKVDRVFTQSLETSSQARAILRSAVLLGHSFGIPVIAEGVETEQQLEFLKEVGCQEVQGFLFGKHLLPSQIKSTEKDKHRRAG
ncbi:bifunctional diguanylate cyclase/phosphodiesterase [Labrenzia sp. PHM005]|uniref:putative bifunctional diguanylate cyclase/phosphodiesterase n=1 Tax=Labrenzia sp. PHM005 TaxID=2590016 RepID=UPI00114029AB|nr:EAL domain-containing protein [Labrenzia sp. PHM005]QDG75835.1 EAL domain-containing protein [Labrenzia sp. PHM005]